MKWTDVTVGPMSPEQIGKEIAHDLNGCKKPSKLMVTIERLDDGTFYTKIYMKVEDFKRKGCDGKLEELCPRCFDILTDIFVY